MQLPLHPMIVHFPLSLSIIVPILILIFAYMIKINKMTRKAWFIVIGIQLAVVVSGYVSLETGETEEDLVEKVVASKYIHDHEEAAEIFVGSAVVVLALAVGVFFIRKELQFPVKIVIATIAFVSSYLAYDTGMRGGELVYAHGAASAYVIQESGVDSILPTPGLNTSESPMPTDENESFKTDENDYGNTDEVIESPDDTKQED